MAGIVFLPWKSLVLLSFWNCSPVTFNEGKLYSPRLFILLLIFDRSRTVYLINGLVTQQWFDSGLLLGQKQWDFVMERVIPGEELCHQRAISSAVSCLFWNQSFWCCLPSRQAWSSAFPFHPCCLPLCPLTTLKPEAGVSFTPCQCRSITRCQIAAAQFAGEQHWGLVTVTEYIQRKCVKKRHDRNWSVFPALARISYLLSEEYDKHSQLCHFKSSLFSCSLYAEDVVARTFPHSHFCIDHFHASFIRIALCLHSGTLHDFLHCY